MVSFTSGVLEGLAGRMAQPELLLDCLQMASVQHRDPSILDLLPWQWRGSLKEYSKRPT